MARLQKAAEAFKQLKQRKKGKKKGKKGPAGAVGGPWGHGLGRGGGCGGGAPGRRGVRCKDPDAVEVGGGETRAVGGRSGH